MFKKIISFTVLLIGTANAIPSDYTGRDPLFWVTECLQNKNCHNMPAFQIKPYNQTIADSLNQLFYLNYKDFSNPERFLQDFENLKERNNYDFQQLDVVGQIILKNQ